MRASAVATAQQVMDRGDSGSSIGGARLARRLARMTEQIRRRREIEERATSIFRAVTTAAGVDALCAEHGFERSDVYARGRGARPPTLAPLIGAIRFDPGAGRTALAALASEIGCVVVPQGTPAPAEPRGIIDLLAELIDHAEESGLSNDIEAARARRRQRMAR